MKTQMCVLPIKCRRCSAIFDLWYDLQDGKNGDESITGNWRIDRKIRESLCWNCREEVFTAFRGNREGETEDEEDFTLEV